MAESIPELTAEQAEDFGRLADAQQTVKECNDVVKLLGGKYRDFMLRFESLLARGIVLGPYRIYIHYTRKLMVERV